MAGSYLAKNPRLSMDYYLALRAWGMILYGALPASLFALGVLKVTQLDMQALPSLTPLLFIGLVPVLVAYLLIRQRLKAWYLMSDVLWFRSAFLTLTILVLSTLICLSAGIFLGKYEVVSWTEWRRLDPQVRWSTLLESLLLSILALVGSSTLFLTAVKDSGGLPGLPTEDFVDDTKSLREKLIAIKHSEIWENQAGGDYHALGEQANQAKKLCNILVNYTSDRLGQAGFYKDLASDLDSFGTVLGQVSGFQPKWDSYFGDQTPANMNPNESKLRTSIQRLKKVRIDA